jgi:transposase
MLYYFGPTAGRWQDLFGAKCDLLLYDLTSTYFEGQAGEIPIARRGYSRDHRPDALQIILAVVVTEEGFPLSYEVFEGNRADVTTLEEILDSVERDGELYVLSRRTRPDPERPHCRTTKRAPR